MPGTEVTLVVLVYAFYLFDCLVLVSRGQALLARECFGWTARFGSLSYDVQGKPVAMLNPLTPFAPAFCALPWDAPEGGRRVRVSATLAMVAGLRYLVVAQAAIVLVAVPGTLLAGSALAFVAAACVGYAIAIAMVAVAARSLRRHGQPLRPLLGPSVSALLCLPLSVNYLRRVTLLLPTEWPTARCARLLRGEDRVAFRRRLLSHVESEIERSDAVPARLVTLKDELAAKEERGRL